MNQRKNKVYILGAGCAYDSGNECEGIKNPLDGDFWGSVRSLSNSSPNKVSIKKFLKQFLGVFYPELLEEKKEEDLIGMEEVFTYVDNILSILRMGGYQTPFDPLDKKDDLGRYAALLEPLARSPELEKIVEVFCKEKSLEFSPRSYQLYRFFSIVEDELIELIHDVLMAINFSSKSTSDGWESETYQKFASKLKKEHGEGHEITVITFNYDLLLEKAFDQKYKNKWTHYLWQHEFDIFHVNEKILWLKFVERKDVLSRENEGKIKILKLHGSINWFAAFKEDAINLNGPEHVFYIPVDNLQYQHDVNSGKVFYSPIISEGCSLKFNQASGKVPQDLDQAIIKRGIVAPIIEKLGKFKKTHLIESLWREAFKAIQSSDEIYVAGYSLPVADYLSRWLLRTAVQLNPNKDGLKVEVISKDQDCNLRKRYHSIFPSLTFKSGGFKAFVEESSK